MEPEIRHFTSMDQLNQAVVVNLLAFAHECVRDTGVFSVALAGGSTPKGLYELLASPVVSKKFPYFNTHFFFGDERCVPPEHDQSNYRMADETLFSNIAIPRENIHRIEAERTPYDETARNYESELKDFFSTEALDIDIKNTNDPLFDVTLLGIGSDGHTASLFPGMDAVEEQQRWVVHSPAPQGVQPPDRISLTLPVINRSRHVYFLVSGSDKARVVQEILDSSSHYPAGQVAAQERLIWFLQGM